MIVPIFYKIKFYVSHRVFEVIFSEMCIVLQQHNFWTPPPFVIPPPLDTKKADLHPKASISTTIHQIMMNPCQAYLSIVSTRHCLHVIIRCTLHLFNVNIIWPIKHFIDRLRSILWPRKWLQFGCKICHFQLRF